MLQAISTSNEFPPAVILGRYNLFEDRYWVAYNKTVQQLRNEGYDVPGDANWMLQVNYTRLDYTLKSKIIGLSWPNVTLQLVEGTHDLNVTARRIMENGSIGERIASFLRTDQPSYVHPYLLEVKDPDLGVGFNPSVFTIGNTFPTLLMTYAVDRTETLIGTPWGQNETYVSVGHFANGTHFYDWTTWCDAESGLFLKLVVETKTPTFISLEEAEIIETGVEWDRFDVARNNQIYQVLVDTNSTLSNFAFNSSASKINLIVDGPAGTSGICNITVPKGLVPTGYSFEVYFDGQKTTYALTEDPSNYYISVTYQHSKHTITISLVSSVYWTQWWFWALIGVVIVIVVGATYYLKKRR